MFPGGVMELLILLLAANVGFYLFILFRDGIEIAPNREQTILCLFLGVPLILTVFLLCGLWDLYVCYSRWRMGAYRRR